MKAKSPSIDAHGFLKPFSGFFKRFHAIVFFVIVGAGLFFAISILLSVINLSSTTASTSSQSINDTFDEETIRRIETLGSGGGSSPGRRASPFVE